MFLWNIFVIPNGIAIMIAMIGDIGYLIMKAFREIAIPRITTIKNQILRKVSALSFIRKSINTTAMNSAIIIEIAED